MIFFSISRRVLFALAVTVILSACGGSSGEQPPPNQDDGNGSQQSSMSSDHSSSAPPDEGDNDESGNSSSSVADNNSSESSDNNHSDGTQSSSSSAPAAEEANYLDQVRISALAGGSVRFSITVPMRKDAVHVFARRNGAQDFVVNDIQSQSGAEVDNGDGTFTYHVVRESSYDDGDRIEARFFSFEPGAGQLFYPGPTDATWVSLVYAEGAESDEYSTGGDANSSSSSSSDPDDSSSSSSSPPNTDYSEGGYTPPHDPDYQPTEVGGVMPLFHAGTPLEPVITYETDDALITRFSDRARDRHAKEDQFQQYDHFLSFYWEHRTAAIEIIDRVAKGGDSIRMNVRTQWRLNDLEAENRWFYVGRNTVAEFCDNGTMEVIDDLNYYKERSHNCRQGRAIQLGDRLEFEISQFLAPGVPNGRAPYYGTTYLYIVGEGIVPWNVGGTTPAGGIKDSVKIPERAWLGGDTTLHANTSGEPQNRFMQMATNLGYDNAQPFVEGRRVLHTSFVDGTHDELPAENPVFEELAGLSGPRYINEACSDCHVRNGRAVPEALGEHLEKWVFQVGDEEGNPHPYLGRVLQAEANQGAESEGQVFIASWFEQNGLRRPVYEFTGVTPERFSARIAPQLVGMGLLEAIPEEAILALEDPYDESGDGISGRANRVVDPETGETRLGRFGWKAGKVSILHQVVGALNTDMGVMTSVMPEPDCGSAQTDCGPSGAELDDIHVENLVKYIALLGVPPQQNYDDPAVMRGETAFSEIGCASCHTPSFQTSPYHPLAELRDQTIYPYTDMLLHDMGPDMADTLGEGEASGSEWRTAPLWGLGHSACVTGGMTQAPPGQRECTPEHGYLHDGRARTIEEAILWHGGEGESAKNAYEALSESQQQDVLEFLRSL
ncbi:di-heme oxidoreductase family protein [Marinimicrobium alkaliphilum]|uniref:di-heme oxidoreductase family protein n=1 Tax=Marinimicrobium alkaliphilum TaxID=2202654 RepID=UPI000DBA282E|nr:di-heme oxidoredictase family protein [Marinimicrobium alkaliphilum]